MQSKHEAGHLVHLFSTNLSDFSFNLSPICLVLGCVIYSIIYLNVKMTMTK